MPLYNDAPMNRQLAALDKQFDKYGHDAQITTATDTYNTRVLSLGFAVANAVGGATTIVNPNYRLYLQVKSGYDDLKLTDKVVINSKQLNIVAFKKVTPDVANAIVWEVEATGGVVPKDPSAIQDPLVVFPEQLQEYVPSYSGTGPLEGIAFQGTAPKTTGGAYFVSSEWEAREEVSLASIATATVPGGIIWNSPLLFSKTKNYQVRVRYNAADIDAAPLVSEWSTWHTFSRVNLIDPAPPLYINKPTFLVRILPDGSIDSTTTYAASDTKVIGKKTYTVTNLCKAYLISSLYSPVDAGALAYYEFQMASDSAFTTLVASGNQSANWVDGIGGLVYKANVFTLGMRAGEYPLTKDVLYYARVRHASVDSKFSEWSDTLTFKVLLINREQNY